MTAPIAEIYTAFLREDYAQRQEKRKDRPEGFSISMYGRCFRQAVISRAGLPVEDRSDNTIATFDLGFRVEDGIMAALRWGQDKFWYKLYEQVRVFTPDKEGVGHIDVYIEWDNGDIWLIDIKSCHETKIKKYGPDENYRIQVGGYAWCKLAAEVPPERLYTGVFYRSRNSSLYLMDWFDCVEYAEKAKEWHTQALSLWRRYKETGNLPAEIEPGEHALCNPKWCNACNLHCPLNAEYWRTDGKENNRRSK